ncbi:hypothetical protein [Novosphingobium sp. M1R2S20]|uniref:Uncharacterized protein n=1 Tax=Novosphingobium rhizovicinum TaxID=3228928 RepID=A0ABV3RAT7_9SPHN
MYEFVDRHPASLSNSGRLVLWAMRGWSESTARKSCPPLALYRGFSRVGAGGAVHDFHTASTSLHGDALAPFTIAPMKSCSISEDEAMLLALWRGVALEDSDLVAGTLKLLVKPEAILTIARSMSGCSEQLKLAGLDLSQPLPLRESLP